MYLKRLKKNESSFDVINRLGQIFEADLISKIDEALQESKNTVPIVFKESSHRLNEFNMQSGIFEFILGKNQ